MSIKPKILVIRQLALGDVLLTTPIVKQLFIDYSGDCEIDVLTMKPEAYINNPYVNEIISPEEFQIERKIYQRTINLDLAYESYPNLHITEAYAKNSHGSINHIKDKKIGIYTTKDDGAFVKELIDNTIKAKYLVIHMRRDTWPSRNLNEDTWRSIVEGILNSTDLTIVQVGSSHEISFDHNPRLINMLNKLTVQQLKLIIENSECYVGIDSGTLHIAASTDAPIVAVFTSAHHQFRQPLGRNNNSIFIPVTPSLDCYGCQSRLPPPITGVICPVGDPYSPPCKDSIPVDKLIKSVISCCESNMKLNITR